MKKNPLSERSIRWILCLIVACSVSGGVAYAAPSSVFQPTILPTSTDTYNLGSASKEWNTIYVKSCVGTGCGSGSGSPGGSSGQLQYNGSGSFAGVATSTLTAGTNVTFTGTPGYLVGGTNLTINATGGGGGIADPFTHPAAGQSATTSLMLLYGQASTSQLTATSSVYLATLGGNVGIGTTSPFDKLSVQGNIQAWGNTYNHFGEVTCNGSLKGFGDALEVCGNQNTDGLAPQIQVGNNSNGTAAYSGYDINNDLGDNTFTHFAGWFLNSSGYTSPTFGTAIANPSLMLLQNTDGATTNITNSNNVANRGYFNWLIGGSNTTNEVARLTTTGLGIGTTTPWAQLSINPNGISGPAFVIGSSTGGTKFVVSNGGNVGIGTAAPGGLLQVNTSNTTQQSLILAGTSQNGNSDASNGASFRLGYNATGNRQLWLGDSAQAGVSGNSSFRYILGVSIPLIDGISNDGATRRNIGIGAQDTNVGIGINAGTQTQTDITAKLTVFAEAAKVGIAINGASAQASHYLDLTSNGGTAGNIFNVTSAGNVGVGTTTPAAQLDVNAPSNSPTHALISASHTTGSANTTDFSISTSTTPFFGIGTTTQAATNHALTVTTGASATTTVNIGSLGLTSSKSCVNMNRADGTASSFYITAAGALTVETNYCK